MGKGGFYVQLGAVAKSHEPPSMLPCAPEHNSCQGAACRGVPPTPREALGSLSSTVQRVTDPEGLHALGPNLGIISILGPLGNASRIPEGQKAFFKRGCRWVRRM